jgi:hypothetical protein
VGAVSEELGRLFSFEERHRRLLARLTLVVAATGVIDACGTAMIYFLERHAHGTEVQSVGQAFFFTTVQLLPQRAQRGSDYCESAFWKKAATAPAAPATTMTAQSSSAMSSARPAGVIGFFIWEETVSSCTVVKKKA